MSDHSKIEWTDSTWPITTGCRKVSPGCDHCYAARLAATRLRGHPDYAGVAKMYASGPDFTGLVRLVEHRLNWPMRWRDPRMIFICSQSDLLWDEVPDWFIAKALAVVRLTRRHTFQLLTKRHARLRALLSSPDFQRAVDDATYDLARDETMPLTKAQRRDVLAREVPFAWPIPNLWVGVSVEDQHWADIRIPVLLDTPAAVRWISAEPLLGHIDLRQVGRDGRRFSAIDVSYDQDTAQPGRRLDWVVAGGESGPDARPMHPDIPRALRDQCADAGVAFLFKQWGDYLPAPIFDAPTFAGGRAFVHPTRGGTSAVMIREVGPSGTFRSGVTRPLEPGDVTQGGVMLLDADTVAVRVGKKAAGRELDGQVHDGYPVSAA